MISGSRAAAVAAAIRMEVRGREGWLPRRARPGLRELLPLVDYVVSSADYPMKLAQEDVDAGLGDTSHALDLVSARRLLDRKSPPPETLARFVLAHCKNAMWVCVTLGADGAVAVGAHIGVTRVPAWPLPAAAAGDIRDTTGAGDAFIGATAAGQPALVTCWASALKPDWAEVGPPLEETVASFKWVG